MRGKQGGNIVITEAIIIAAIENLDQVDGIVKVLLKEQKNNITITNQVIKALVKRSREERDREKRGRKKRNREERYRRGRITREWKDI